MSDSGSDLRRPRALLLAYACSPYHGSERGIGWHRAVTTAAVCDTWVICEGRWSAPDIDRYCDEHGNVPGLVVVPLRKSALEVGLSRVPGLYYLSYYLWHRRAFRLARELHARVQFDLVHQVNYCGYREPGFLWKLGPPFVWGPVGGTQNFPWRFLGEIGLTGALAEALRSAANALQLRFSPRVKGALRRSSALLVANTTNFRDFVRVHRASPTLLLESGITGIAPRLREPNPSGALRILWAGEFRAFKGLSLLVKALACLPRGARFELRVMGRGRAGKRWRRLSRALGVDRHVTWMGWLPHDEALDQYRWADVLAFTSLRDTSGNAVLEALAAGVPVVCFDHQGVGDIVTAASGVKIPVTTPADAVAGFSAAIRRLSENPEWRASLGEGATARAREYLWSGQHTRMMAVYRRVLAGSFIWAPRPASVTANADRSPCSPAEEALAARR